MTELNVTEGVIRFQARYMRTLGQRLVLNEYGLPTGFWQTDRVVTMMGSDDAEPPDDAWVQLDYNSGFPTIGISAVPFWDALPGEPVRYYNHFSAYLQQEGARNIQAVALEVRQDPSFMQSLFDLYHWGHRAKAFDLFREVSAARFRAVQAPLVESQHLQTATALFKKANDWLTNNFDKLSGREVIEILKTSVQLQRMSLHLPINGVKDVQGAESKDIKTLMLELSSHNHFHVNGESSEDLLAKALANPEAAKLSQELALHIRKPGKLLSPKVVEGAESEIPSAQDDEDIVHDILAGAKL